MVNFPAHVVVTFFISLVTSLDLQAADGVLVPGGFGDRGVQGKILATKYARENRIPFLGICLGMQIAVIEFARSVLGLKDANSTEFDPNTKNPCVIFMPEVYVSTWLKLILKMKWNKNFVCFSFWHQLSWYLYYVIRAQQPTWEEPCVWDQGGHISRLWTANLQSCKHYWPPPRHS